jgi:hypothetical protein
MDLLRFWDSITHKLDPKCQPHGIVRVLFVESLAEHRLGAQLCGFRRRIREFIRGPLRKRGAAVLSSSEKGHAPSSNVGFGLPDSADRSSGLFLSVSLQRSENRRSLV